MERLTNRDKEIPLPNADNALFWARVHEKLAKYEDAEERCNPCKPTQPECGECEYAKPVTHADRIRSMTDEELAKLLDHDCPPRSALDICPQYESGKPYTQEGCYQCRLAWLKQEVSDAL